MPAVVLNSALRATVNDLNFSHINGGSLYPKIDEFRRIFEGSRSHVVVASETWFKSYRNNKAVSVEGYELFRNDRVARRSGGVAIYVMNGIKTKVVRSSIGVKSEFLFIELIFPNFKVLVGGYYKAPNVDEIDLFEDVLTELMPGYADVVVLGALNENLLLHDERGNCSKCVQRTCGTCRLKRCFVRLGLQSLGSVATNFDQTPSQIDLILTNRPEKFSVFNQVGSGLSNHDIKEVRVLCK